MMKNFFSSNPNSKLDGIVFENRNKNYGAFVLRNEEGFILRKALFIGVSICVVLASTPLIVNALKSGPDLTKPMIDDPIPVDLKQIYQKDKPEKPLEIQKKIEQPKVNTVDTRTPTPTRDPIIEKPVQKVDNKKAVAGVQDTKGDDPVVPYTPPVRDIPNVNNGNGTSTVKTDPVEDPNKIQPSVDVKADFIGGIDKFRTKVMGNLDTSDFEDYGTIKTEVSFVVEKDGSISQVVAKGNDKYFNKEAERAVKSVKGMWKPAELKGKKVRSYFKIPISLRFD